MRNEPLEVRLLELLRNHGRLSPDQIGSRLGIPADEAAAMVTKLEESHAILGYQAVVDHEALGMNRVEAIVEAKVNLSGAHSFDDVAHRVCEFPEVASLYLSSGEADFVLLVEGRQLSDISKFLTEKLTTIPEITSTTSHFVLKKYKKEGVMVMGGNPENRLAVTP